MLNKYYGLILPIIAMGLVILISNVLVVHPLPYHLLGIDLANWSTYGAFTYPLAFLVTDLTNRYKGVRAAKIVAVPGFAVGVGLSLLFADWRIALASGLAFGLSQGLDIYLFDRLRRQVWWKAPLFSSLLASILDTGLFFFIAFYGTDVPWVGLSVGDLAVKILMALMVLPLFYGMMRLFSYFQIRQATL